MKKLLCALLAVVLMFSLVACQTDDGGSADPNTSDNDNNTTPTADAAFEGKVAIITNTVSQNEEEFRSAEAFQAKYGADKVIHQTWPDNFMTEQEQMVTIVSKIAADPEVKALIINQAVPGTNNAVDKLLETRKDMFIVYCNPQDNPVDAAARASLILMPNDLAMGPVMVKQAAEQGAKVFVHYSFPRHMSQVMLSTRRDDIKATCEELGIQYVDATAPDPTSDAGVTGAQQFILEDVPKMIAEYGADTAFFSTNCSMQIPLIKAVVEGGAIYPQPCCPSPFHGFPAALGLESVQEEQGLNVDAMIAATNEVISEYNMEGRTSTWPVPAAMMSTTAGAEYAVLWMKGEVSKEGIDTTALAKCMSDYAAQFADVDIELEAYVENDVTYDNFQLLLMGYLTYNGVEN